MSEIASVYVEIGAKVDGLTKALDSVQQELTQTRNEVGKAEGGFGSLWKQFALGQLAVDALKKGFSLLKGIVADSIKAAAEEEQAQKAVTAALEATGREVPNLSKHFNDYATQLSRVTNFSGESINSAQALLIQLTSLDRNGIDLATKGAIGLASVLGMDLTSAASLVAKAMEGNTSALSRYGIRVDESLSAEEKRVQLLEKLNVMYQRAEADTETYAGRMKQLKNVIGDVKEEFGNAIVKSEGFNRFLGELKDKIVALIESGKLEEWAAKATKAFEKVVGAIEWVVKGIDKLNPANHKRAVFFGKEGTKEALDSISDFQKSLEVLKPSFATLEAEALKGGKSWAEYTARVKAADEALVANKDAVQAWMGKAADFLGLQRGSKDAVEATGKAVTVATGKLKDMSVSLKLVETAARRARDFGILPFSYSIGTTALGEVNKFSYNAQKALEDMWPPVKQATQEATTAMSGAWDGLFNGITLSLGSLIQTFAEGGMTIVTLWNRTWKTVREMFFTTIAQMIAEWLVGFVKKFVKSVAEDMVGASKAGFDAVAGSASSSAATAQLAFATSFAAITVFASALFGFLEGGWNRLNPYYEDQKKGLDEIAAKWRDLGNTIREVLDLMREYARTIDDTGLPPGRGGGATDPGDPGWRRGGAGGRDLPRYAVGGVALVPQVAYLAEREPEVIIPMSDFNAGSGLAAGVGSSGTVVNLTINAQTLDDQTIRKASEKIFQAVQYEQRRLGRG